MTLLLTAYFGIPFFFLGEAIYHCWRAHKLLNQLEGEL